MNQGVVHSSPVQQMVAAAGNPAWWSIGAPPPPRQPPHHHHGFADCQLDHQQQLPDSSWSQLLLGGLVGEGGNLEAKKQLEMNWEQQFLNIQTNTTSSHNCGGVIDVKQEISRYNFNCNWSTHHQQEQMVSASSPNSSSITNATLTNKSHLRDHFSSRSSDLSSECNSSGTGGAAKKPRTQPSSAHSTTIKVRKEKLGDRVTALHQLVSPFGKTDTASVLLEAIGYIKFLESQIEALSQPYLGSGSLSAPTLTQQQHPPLTECSEKEPKQDLKSRGLCLVPISCTLHVGSDNGADYWAPAFGTATNFR